MHLSWIIVLFLLIPIQFQVQASPWEQSVVHATRIKDAHNIETLTSQATAIRQLLLQIPTIRVAMGDSPGIGHQANTVLVMKRIRSLGYRGYFEVIYSEEGGYSTVKKKVMSLFPTPDPKITFVDKKYFTNTYALRDRVALTVTGGMDLFPDIRHEHLSEIIMLKSDIYLAMNPQQWLAGYFVESETLGITELPAMNPLGPKLKVPIVKDWQGYLSHYMNAHDYRQRGQALVHLLSKLQGMESSMWYGSERLDSRLPLIKAMVEMLGNKTSPLKSGIVIPVLGDLTLEKLQLELVNSGLGRHVELTTLEDVNLGRRLASHPNNKILFVKVGHLPQEVFFQFFRLGTMPAVTSGKGTKHLMESLGKPYISAIPLWTELTEDVLTREYAHPQMAKVHAVSEAFENRNHRDWRRGVVATYGNYLNEAMNPKSELRQFFRTLAHYAAREDRDLVLRSMVAIRHLLASKLIVSACRDLNKRSQLHK